MWKPANALDVSRSDRELLETLVRRGTTPQRVALRASIILGAADGRSNYGLAKDLSITRPTVLLWRERYARSGIAGLLKDAPRPGRPKQIGSKKVETIVNATLHTTPRDATHWSTRTMARRQGVSQATVTRIWQAYGLQPHRSETFKLSRDPDFVRKLRDVVGLYLNPPDKALLLCVDEKSQIQALDRTQPGLPMKKGRCGTMTHDYKRHGTTTLFAALSMLDGTIIGDCLPRHRHQEFIRFLKKIDAETPAGLDLHLIVDNYGTHKHPSVKRWLKRNPRFHLHFIPTSSSWLNMVERWFREITDKRIRRGTFRNVPVLIEAIKNYIDNHNQNPQVFVWTAPVAQILTKVAKSKEALDALH